MAERLNHYGFPNGPALCGADGPRWTAIRLVSCRYCQNILDLFIHQHAERLIAVRVLERLRLEAAPGKEPHPHG